MKHELTERLYNDYPKIFRQKDEDMTKTCMCWGIEVDDGWYDLIDALCHQIQSHCQWRDINVEAVQVKEKFGGLRFYVDCSEDYLDGAIDMAEEMSYRICERCGKPGKARGGGWIRTLCDECDSHKVQVSEDED